MTVWTINIWVMTVVVMPVERVEVPLFEPERVVAHLRVTDAWSAARFCGHACIHMSYTRTPETPSGIADAQR